MESKTKDKEIKRVYEKPKLLTIELTLNEVLSFGCKIESGGGPVGSCEIVSCSAPGS